jgi:hypothetical protein
MLISIIEELGMENIPETLISEWIEEVKTIEILTGDYPDEGSNS